MSGIYDLTNQNIETTYQRILQTPDGTTFYDGTGSLVTLPSANTASLLTTASATGNTITFTKGDGSTFPVTVTGGGTGTPGGFNTNIQFNSASLFSGSGNLSFDYVNNNILLTGSLLVSQSHISTVDYIDFTLLPLGSLPAHNQGRLHWFDDTKTLQIDTDKNDFMIEVGHQSVVRVYNDTGNDIISGSVVRISGSQGNQPKIVTASWNDDASSAATLGLVATTVLGSGGNKHGYVVTSGILRNVNTSLYPVGTQLYLSSSGQFTNTPPDAPLHEVRLGKVIVQNATTGIIYVDVMNGYELTELHDVRTTGYSDGDLLIQSGSLWINSKTLTGSYTLSGSLTTNDGVSVQSLTASFVSASSITGSLFGTASLATTAASINVTSSTTNTNFLIPFTDRTFAQSRTGSVQLRIGSAGTGLLYNPVSDALNVTLINANSVIGNLSGTASYAGTASYVTASNVYGPYGANSVLSASWAPGSSPTPGGSDTYIQFNSQSAFGGNGNLTYQYNTSATDAYQLKHESNIDFSFNRFYADQYKASIVINNTSGVAEKQLAGITNHQYRQAANTGKTTMFKFAAGGGNGGGTTLNVLGFKCDYSLALYDGTYYTATRIGTLQGVWDFDNNYAPIIQDNSISGDITYNQLQLAEFSLTWNGNDIELQLDTSAVDYDVVFNGLFNIFSQTAI